MTTNLSEKLGALFLRWQYFKPAPERVAELEALIHEARRSAFEECALLADVHANSCDSVLGLDFRALATKEGEA